MVILNGLAGPVVARGPPVLSTVKYGASRTVCPKARVTLLVCFWFFADALNFLFELLSNFYSAFSADALSNKCHSNKPKIAQPATSEIKLQTAKK